MQFGVVADGHSARTAAIPQKHALCWHTTFFLSPTKLEPEAVLLAILASLSPDAPLL
jgi:hypothetical protein